jgi:hypothetical protein
VYWKIEGAVSINDYSVFRGNIICNNGALGALNTGVQLYGRAFTTTGALTTTAMNAGAPTQPSGCATVGIETPDASAASEAATIYPNPFNRSTTVMIRDASMIREVEFILYNVLGEVVLNTTLITQATTIQTGTLQQGIYFYKITGNHKTIQAGRLISQQ